MFLYSPTCDQIEFEECGPSYHQTTQTKTHSYDECDSDMTTTAARKLDENEKKGQRRDDPHRLWKKNKKNVDKTSKRIVIGQKERKGLIAEPVVCHHLDNKL